MLAVSDENTVLIAVTTAMPIIRAAAVMAVRRGLRDELRRPSLPGIDQENSRPSADTIGLLSIGVSSAPPMNVTPTPVRIVPSVWLPALPASPYASAPP